MFPSSLKHHESVLKVMLEFIHSEHLTDVTFTCSDGQEINTHRKILAQISPLVRKQVSMLPSDQRVTIILPDVTSETVIAFLSVLYVGEAKVSQMIDIDKVHDLCRMLSISFPGKSFRVIDNKKSSKEIALTDEVASDTEEESDYEDSNDENADSDDGTSLNLGIGNQKPSKSLKENKSNSKEKKTRKKDNKENLEEEPEPAKVFCLCREPERPNMIGCDFCEEWYHYNCLNLTKSEAKELTKKEWKCPNCEYKTSVEEKKLQKDYDNEKDDSDFDVESENVSEEENEKIVSGRKNNRKVHKQSQSPVKSSSRIKSSRESKTEISAKPETANENSGSNNKRQRKSLVQKDNESDARIPPKKRKSNFEKISRDSEDEDKGETDEPSKRGSPTSSTSSQFNELFFCYTCKAIFVSNVALAAHRSEKHPK